MAEKGTYLVPTCCVTSAMLADRAVSAAVPAHIHKRYVEFDEMHMTNVALAKDRGVTIAMGTDAGIPGNHHGDNTQELAAMVHGAGLTPHEAVAAATVNAAGLLGQHDNLGSLDAGKYADVVGFASDPLADIDAIRDVRLVVKGGTVARNDLER